MLPAGDASIATAVAIAQHIPGVATEGLPALFPIALFLYFVIFINLLLFVFNLIPLPPLDGSHILRHFLPYKAAQIYDRMGMFALLILFLVGGRFIAAFFYPIYNVFNHILFSV
jgi:Zn-dependent protease